MTHLGPDVLVDLAEGRRPESGEPHLLHCDQCRRHVVELRALINAAASVDVPEPSPLFWEHFSERVRQAVQAEGVPSRAPWLNIRLWFSESPWRLAAPLAAAVILIVVSFGRHPTAPPTFAPAPGSAAVEAAPDLLALPEFGSDDDSSLALVGALASQMDADAVVESGLANHAGSRGNIDEIVVSMTASERSELRRILRDELAKS